MAQTPITWKKYTNSEIFEEVVEDLYNVEDCDLESI